LIGEIDGMEARLPGLEEVVDRFMGGRDKNLVVLSRSVSDGEGGYLKSSDRSRRLGELLPLRVVAFFSVGSLNDIYASKVSFFSYTQCRNSPTCCSYAAFIPVKKVCEDTPP